MIRDVGSEPTGPRHARDQGPERLIGRLSREEPPTEEVGVRDMWQQVSDSVGGYLPSLVGAIALLLLFWLGAVVLSAIVRKVVKRYELDVKVLRLLDPNAKATRSGEWVGRIVFIVVMLFGLSAFFNALDLDLVTEPVNRMLGEVFEFAPRLLGAGLILILAWLLASLVRLLSARGLGAARVDERLEDAGAATKGTLAKSVSSVLYWLVLLLFLPMILDILSLEGLLAPVQSMLNGFLGFLPNLFAAGLILLIGWFLARIVRQIVTGLLEAAGADRLATDETDHGSHRMRVSSIGGTIVYALILLPVVVASLDALALGAVADPAKQMLGTVLDALPNVLTAFLILGLAYLVARLVSGLVSDLLGRLGFDNLFSWLGIRRNVEPGTRTPSQMMGSLVLVATIYLAAVEASRQLGFTVLTELLADFAVFAGQVFLGLVIFALGLYLSRFATTLIESTQGRHSGLLARAARVSILIFSAAMALRQMGIAEDIVTTAFTLLLGALAVAFAIAFGLGGRDAARAQLEKLGVVSKREGS